MVSILAEGVARQGDDVRVICSAEDEARVDEIPVEGDGRLVIDRRKNLATVWSQPITPGLFAAAGWTADVVHLHHPNPLADLVALARCKAPIVVTHHSDVRRQKIARPFYMPVINAVLRRAARILVPTESHIDVSDELDSFRSKVQVVPFGVDHRSFFPPSEKNGGADEPEGLFVGRLVGYKGLDVLLDAVAGSDLKIAIAGEGPLRESLENQRNVLGIEKQVRFLGGVAAGDLPDLYRAADYFVLPSVTEAEMFGVVLVEAMASGLPVVYTDLETGVKEVPEAGITGLRVPRSDPKALREALTRIASDRSVRSKMGSAARKRVEDLFTLERTVESHRAVYQDVCG